MTDSGEGGMFDPLSPEERRAGEHVAPAGRKDDYTPVIPVPEDAPDPDWRKLRPKEAKGDPEHVWTYPTEEGGVAFYVVRWKARNGPPEKIIRPATWSGREWRLKAMPAPRPLYGLPNFLRVPRNALVVVPEGEKCADAVAEAWHPIATVTWSGGADAWGKTDWQPLSDRKVLLIADPGEPGHKAMKALAAHLYGLRCRVQIHLPEGDAGDDIADWLARDGGEATRERVKKELTDFLPITDQGSTVDYDVDDWQSELLERVKGNEDAGVDPDPGAPFDPEAAGNIRKLRRESPSDWQRFRAKLKEAGVRIGDLDRATTPVNGGIKLQGRALEWPEPEPHPNVVDGSVLLHDIAAFIGRYVDMRPVVADALALWIVHTWIHNRPQLEISTFLNVTSPTKRCGKSLLMDVLAELVYRPLRASSVTPAALFRTIELYEPTLLLDEADTYFDDDTELRGIVNGSQRRDGASVLRTGGDDHEPRAFRTWCPKAISGIGGLPDTTLDRALVIRLERRDPAAAPLPLWRDRDRNAVANICGQIARWVADECEAIFAARDKVSFPSGLHDRARDAWEVLLAIGDAAGGDWSGPTGRAWRAAQEIGADAADETGSRETLLADLRTAFEQRGDPDAMSTKDILTCLNAMDGRPWPEWRRGKELSARGLAKLLEPFGITPGTVRLDQGQTLKGYKRAAFERVWMSYDVLPSEDPPAQPVTTSQVKESAGFGDSQSVTGPDDVTDTKLLKPASSKGCDVVTDTKPPLHGEEVDPASADVTGDDIEREAIMEFDGSPSPDTTPKA